MCGKKRKFPLSEFAAINHFCRDIGYAHQHTKLAVGDDAAIVSLPSHHELAISTDTMLEGRHFLADIAPDDLAYKILAVNVSDMAAMGAKPMWCTLALSLPSIDRDWISAFSTALNETASAYELQLIGGDTTQGALSLTLTIVGLLPMNTALTRSGAKPGDHVYVSGCLGDAALALAYQLKQLPMNDELYQQVKPALLRPVPPIQFAQGLRDIASSCLDISDGLVGDLQHIANQSQVNLTIDSEQVPVSDAYRQYRAEGGGIELALTGGDDYQLAFTVPKSQEAALFELAQASQTTITRIGSVEAAIDQQFCVILRDRLGDPITLSANSYQHFT